MSNHPAALLDSMRLPMRLTLLPLLALSSTVVFGQTQVCPSPSGRSVVTTGSARLLVPPDSVSFSVGVVTEGLSIPQALRANSEKVRAVLSALKNAGVAPEEVQTSHLRIRSRDEDDRHVEGFRVENRVSVTRKDPKSAGELLQAAVDAGANQAEGPHFFVADEAALRDRGFDLAFKDARDRGEKLASLSGKVLGDVVCVAEGGYPQGGALYETIEVTAAPIVETGVEELTFSVSVVFELE